MVAVSIMTAHAIASRGLPITLIMEGNRNEQPNELLKNQYGLDPLPLLTLKLYPRHFWKFRITALFYIRTVFYILASKRSYRKNVIISRNTTILPWLCLLRVFGCRVFFETHSYHGKCNLEGIPRNSRRRFFSISSQYDLIERIFLKLCHGLICITGQQQKLYTNDFIRIPITTVPLGSTPPSLVSCPAGNLKKHLVYAGRAVRSVEDRVIFRAIASCREQGVFFSWIGVTPGDIERLKSLAFESGVSDRVTFKEWMPHSEMRRFLQQNAGAGLAAYKPLFMTGALLCPTKIFDYFAAGLPVVAPDLPTIQEYIGDGEQGVLYRAGDSESLASAIFRIFSDRGRYVSMQKSCREAAITYSWENRAAKLIHFTMNA